MFQLAMCRTFVSDWRVMFHAKQRFVRQATKIEKSLRRRDVSLETQLLYIPDALTRNADVSSDCHEHGEVPTSLFKLVQEAELITGATVVNVRVDKYKAIRKGDLFASYHYRNLLFGLSSQSTGKSVKVSTLVTEVGI